MKKRISNKSAILIALLLSLVLFNSKAQDKPLTIVGGALEGFAACAGCSTSVQLSIPQPYQVDKTATGFIRLIFLPNKLSFMPSQHDIEVDYTYKLYKHVTGAHVFYQQSTGTFRISQKVFQSPQLPFKDQDYKIFDAGSGYQKIYGMEVTINAIRVDNVPVSTLLSNVRLETSIDYVRYGLFDLTAPSGLSVSFVDQDCDPSHKESIKVEWSPHGGATRYELEYSAINNYQMGGGNKPINNADFDFKNNSTRVITKDNFYYIPNVFDKSEFAFRVRAVGLTDYATTPPVWTESPGEWAYIYDILGSDFPDNLNWQYNATFAEEGKQKSVINFADGSGRSRQTITQNNSDHTTIVGQTIYDFTGRPAITVLPSPIPDAICSGAGSNAQNSYLYRADLNRSASGTFSKYDFELDQSSSCITNNAPMVNTSGGGAGVYYSPMNTNKSGQQAFVPDAGGYPYSQKEYTGDNTGRIKRQGGVGPEFQLGQHDTKYLYGAPEQIELDRLFGSEVGDASHYQKNLIIDPNGQISVSYIDMAGKTVATALTGAAPNNLDAIPQPAIGTLRADMFNKNSKGVSQVNLLNPDGDAIVFNKSILVSNLNSPNTFTYEIFSEPLKLTCVPNICFNCVYDFNFTITDDCGTLIYSSPASNKRLGKVIISASNDTTFDLTCANPLVPYNYKEISPALLLQPGVYYVSKTFSVNKQARDLYLKNYLDKTKNTCILDVADFELSEMAKITDTLDCFTTCDKCLTELGSKDSYVSKGRGTELEWQISYDNCKELCQTKTSCDIYLNQLLADVSPNGQYGSWTNPTDPLSVFNAQNLLPKNVNTAGSLPGSQITASSLAYWRFPKVMPSGPLYYVDPNGLRATVKLTKLPQGSTSNPGSFDLALLNLAQVVQTSPSDFYTYPENLANISDFIARWQPSWAKSLVYMHPEYCYYLDCPNKFGATFGSFALTSNDFDAILLSAKNFNDALAKGLLSLSGSNYVFNAATMDPAMSTLYNPIIAGTPLSAIYTTYNVSMGPLSMPQYAAYVAKCLSQQGTNQTNVAGCTVFCASTDNMLLKDKQWSVLKALYMSEKAKLMAEYSDKLRLDVSGASCNYYNGCIGKADFNGYNSPLVVYNTSNGNLDQVNSKYFQKEQPCNVVMKDLYATKIKRFNNAIANPKDENEAAYQIYLQTGKCPLAFDLQNLADELAKNLRLKNPPNMNNVPVPEPLHIYPQLTTNLYNYFNNLPAPPATYVNYLWKTSIVGANDLKVDIQNTYLNAVAKTITFHPPASGPINWDQVSRITQLVYLNTVGATYYFSCVAKEQNGSTFTYKNITGETDIEIAGCMFKDVCKPNDLAKELQTLMSTLKVDPNPTSSNLFGNVIIGASGGLTLYGNSLTKIQQTLGGTSTSSYRWKQLSANKFELSDNANATPCKLLINFLSISPGSLNSSLFNGVYSFSNIKSDYQNFFTMEARGANNTLVGTIKGEIFKSCSGVVTPVSMGTCGKPDPAECETKYHKNQKDLQTLLQDILINQKYSAGSNNVMTNPNLTSGLLSNFGPMGPTINAVKNTVSNPYYRYLQPDFIPFAGSLSNDSLSITFKSPCVVPGGGGGGGGQNPNRAASTSGETTSKYSSGETNAGGGGYDPNACIETIYCTLWLKTNIKVTPANYTFSDIVSVGPLVGYGNTSSSGSYRDFYMLITHLPMVNGKYKRDTLFGSSCIDIQNCKSCGAPSSWLAVGNTMPVVLQRTASESRETQQLNKAGQRAIANGDVLIDSSSVVYKRYTDAVNLLNGKLAKGTNDRGYIQPAASIDLKDINYLDAAGVHLDFISKFDPKHDSISYVSNIKLFLSNYAYLKTTEYGYNRYKKSVKQYNARASLIGGATLDTLSFNTFMAEGSKSKVEDYILYLSQYKPSPSVAPSALQSFTTSSPSKYSSASINVMNRCDSLYQAYITARNYYIISHPNYTHPPLLQPNDFSGPGRNYCCDKPGYLYFTQYISLYYSTTQLPPQTLPMAPPCEPSPIEDCITRFQNYQNALSQFNISPYAVDNGFGLFNTFPAQESFANQGYCNCSPQYIQYLQNYQGTLPRGVSPPVTIREYPGCAKSTFCDKTYATYTAAVASYNSFNSNNAHPNIPAVYGTSAFTKNGYCYCADAYSQFLNGVVNGGITDNSYISANIDIATYCAPLVVSCAQPDPLDTVESPAYPGTAQDPCMKYKKEVAKANAKTLYGEYVAAQSSLFISQYNAKCLSATESLLRDYADREYHYTLYYYDQAGNLIKTIPPAGLDATFYNSIKKYTDANALRVRYDRYAKRKTVVVDHAQASIYVYNSLNQLVKQKIPDHESMASEAFKYNYTFGVDTNVNILSSQVLDQNKGYLAGVELVSLNAASTFFKPSLLRGKMFESNDACETWTEVGNLVGSDLKKVQFLFANGVNYGFAVGSDGTFMISYDGGIHWDQLAIPFQSKNNSLLDLKAMVNTAGKIEVVAVGLNGTVVDITCGSGADPNAIIFNQKGNSTVTFAATDSITDVTGAPLANNTLEFYITVFNTVDRSTRIFKRQSVTNINGNNLYWTDITSMQVLDLHKVRHLKGSSTCYAVGKDGNLLRSTDDGVNWYMKKTGQFGTMRDAFFSTVNIGVAIIDDPTLLIGRLYKTSDGGSNWVLIDQSLTNNYKTLSPYYFSSNLDKVTANGVSGLVKRVTIDYTTLANPLIGAVGTNVIIGTNLTSQTINDIAVVPYNTSASAFAIACGDGGDIFYCTDYNQNNVTWKFAYAIGNNPKKIVLNIGNPNGSTFGIDAMVLKDGSGIPAYVKNQSNTPFTLSNMNANVTWIGGDINTYAQNPHIIYQDLVYDLHSSTNTYSRAYLIGVENSLGVNRITPFTISGLNGTFNLTPLGNSSSLIRNLTSLSVNTQKGYALAVNTAGNIVKISSGNGAGTFAGSLVYADYTNNTVPNKINDVQINGNALTLVGEDGFFAEKDRLLTTPFVLKESKTALNFNALNFYAGSRVAIPCDKGVLFEALSTNLGAASKYTISTENLNEFAAGSTAASCYIVGNNGVAINADLSLSPPVFSDILTNSNSNINSVAFESGSGTAICVGENNEAFFLAGGTALSNTNWHPNEINKLHFVDGDNGYIVGKKGLIKHTSDGGTTWRTVKPYLNGPLSLSPDLYSVYTTAKDTAIIGGTHNYFSNLTGLTADLNPLIIPTSPNANSVIFDIDFFNDSNAVAVGTKYGTNVTTASLIAVSNHQALTPGSALTSMSGGFRSVYAFKGTTPLKFMAVGRNNTVKFFNGTNFSGSIVWTPLVSSVPMFAASDSVNAITFADNKDGYLGGVKSKLGSIDVDIANSQAKVFENNTSAIYMGTQNTNNINSLCIVDNGGIKAFLGGYISGTSKYNWTFGHDKGKYSDLFWYDKLGRMVLSQNAEQFPNKYSYTRYDALGRIIELGQKTENGFTSPQFSGIFGTLVNSALSNKTIDDNKMDIWLSDGSGLRTEVTHNYYDKIICGNITVFTQENLRRRVSMSTFEEVENLGACSYDHATFYSYDLLGNVVGLLQHNPKLQSIFGNNDYQYKVITYDYDQISGKINRINYQAGKLDAFYHQYEYDADNRLTEVKTSRNGLVWETDAKYFYFKHGPLARVEYGHDKVQGMDYAYTAQGWIKGVNSNRLVPSTDIGQDGITGTNKFFGRDAMGYTLGYYVSTEDYTPINAAVWGFPARFVAFPGNSGALSIHLSARKDLYNGNISSVATTISEPYLGYGNVAPSQGFDLVVKPMVSAYRYDQLNRLTNSNSYLNYRATGNDWFGTNSSVLYNNAFTYDANGNIQTQKRRNDSNTLEDDLIYNYDLDAMGRPKNNKLTRLDDAISGPNFAGDLDPQIVNNYMYDKIGNLRRDWSEEIDGIAGGGKMIWTSFGKIKEVRRDQGSSKDNIKFDYDTEKRRIAKHHYTSSGIWLKSTYYIRDVQGNVMATYVSQPEQQYSYIGANYILKERNLYGQERIGMDKREVVFTSIFYPQTLDKDHERYVGNKHFELVNHLGNVTAVVSDIKIPVPATTGIDHFAADLVTSTDYYPFGQPLKNRNFSTANYRYGFNGKENDNEIQGEGNFQDYGLRVYDPRLARFLSVDPLSAKFPYYSPFHFGGNSPILNVDWDGAEDLSYLYKQDKSGLTLVSVTDYRNTSEGMGSLGHGIQVKIVNSKEVRQSFFPTCLLYQRKDYAVQALEKIFQPIQKNIPKGDINNSFKGTGIENAPFVSMESGLKVVERAGPFKFTQKWSNTQGSGESVTTSTSSEAEITTRAGSSINTQAYIKGNLIKPDPNAVKLTLTVPLLGLMYLQVTSRLATGQTESIEVGLGASTAKPDYEVKVNVHTAKDVIKK